MSNLLLVVLLSYFLGNFFPSLLLARLNHYTGFRNQGSGNVGATNVWRTGHKLDGFLTFLGDAGKGALAIYLASIIEPSSFALGCAGISVLLGHIYPISLRFQGGKGVATSFGIFLMWGWPLALGLIAIWLLILVCTRTASLASLTVAMIAPFAFGFLTEDASIGNWVASMSLIIIWAHRHNIVRLIRGKEHNI